MQGFDKTELLTSGGVTLAGQRYIYLSGTDRVIRAKLGKMGVHCMKTQQGKFVFGLSTTYVTGQKYMTYDIERFLNLTPNSKSWRFLSFKQNLMKFLVSLDWNVNYLAKNSLIFVSEIL